MRVRSKRDTASVTHSCAFLAGMAIHWLSGEERKAARRFKITHKKSIYLDQLRDFSQAIEVEIAAFLPDPNTMGGEDWSGMRSLATYSDGKTNYSALMGRLINLTWDAANIYYSRVCDRPAGFLLWQASWKKNLKRMLAKTTGAKLRWKIGRAIARRRASRCWSPSFMGTALGLDPEQILGMESGLHRLTVEELYSIASVLEVSPAALLPREAFKRFANFTTTKWWAKLQPLLRPYLNKCEADFRFDEAVRNSTLVRP